MRLTFPAGLLALSLFLGSTPAVSQAGQASEFQVGVDFMEFGYQEFDTDGTLLDEEHGILPGLLLSYTAHWPKWYLTISTRLQGGVVEYDGMTQSVIPGLDGLPLTSRTDTFISETVLLFGRKFGHQPHDETALYGGVGYHYWFRGIRPSYTDAGDPVSGLDEDYQWFYLLLGGRVTLVHNASVSFGLDVQARYPFAATMEVTPPGYDRVSLDLGETWAGRVSLPFSWYFNARTRLVVEPYYETWDFDQSPPVELTVFGGPDPFGQAVVEPRNATRNYGLWLKVGFYY